MRRKKHEVKNPIAKDCVDAIPSKLLNDVAVEREARSCRMPLPEPYDRFRKSIGERGLRRPAGRLTDAVNFRFEMHDLIWPIGKSAKNWRHIRGHEFAQRHHDISQTDGAPGRDIEHAMRRRRLQQADEAARRIAHMGEFPPLRAFRQRHGLPGRKGAQQ